MPPLVGRWTTVAGLRLFSRVGDVARETNALPIVHVHGFAISGRYLEPTAACLASHYPTYVPDLPGHGHSEKPSRPLNIPELAEALAGYLDSVGVPRAVILGNSSGCLVAAEFAHRYPERTECAVLVSPAGGAHNRATRTPRATASFVGLATRAAAAARPFRSRTALRRPS